MPDWLKFTNRGQSTLDGGIDDDDITLAVADPSKFPITFPFRLTIDNEIVEVTDGGGTAIDPYDITRGEEGTTPAAHLDKVVVRLNITAGVVEQVQDELDTHGTATTGVHGVGVGTVAKTADITATKLDDFAAPDDNTDLDASTSKHGLVVKATAPAAGLYNYVGITNGETAYTNKALFDATNPSTQAFGDSAAPGSAAVSARRDHKHAMMADPVPTHSALTTGVHAFNKGVKVWHNAAQSIPNNTATILSFNQEDFDLDDMHDNTTNNSRLTIKTAGLYMVLASIQWDSGSTGYRELFILHNGNVISKYSIAAHDYIGNINFALKSCSVNDYFQVHVWHTQGASLNVLSEGSHNPMFCAVRIA